MEATKEELEAQKGNGEGKEEETTPVEGANAAKNRKKRERAKAKKAAEEAGENLDKMAGKIDEEEKKQSEPKGVDNDDKNEGEGEGDAEKKKKKSKSIHTVIFNFIKTYFKIREEEVPKRIRSKRARQLTHKTSRLLEPWRLETDG